MVKDAIVYLQQQQLDAETISVVPMEGLEKEEMSAEESESVQLACLLLFDVALIDVELDFDSEQSDQLAAVGTYLEQEQLAVLEIFQNRHHCYLH